MSWRVVFASEIGTSHIKNCSLCQDDCFGEVLLLPTNQPLLTIWVSDGAGSAICGGEGAQLAVNTARRFAEEKIKTGDFVLSEDFAVGLIQKLQHAIGAQAQEASLKPRDFACTFVGVVSSAEGTLVFQIGDSSAVVGFGHGLELAITPMTGEYANMTYFVTDENAIQNLKTKIYDEKALLAAVFSDGLQRLALDLSKNMPHEPFFLPFFDTMKAVDQDDFKQLDGLLRSFLDSENVNARTDDDKTLALAVWVDGL